MKRLIYLLLLVVMVGGAFANIAPERRLSRPLVYLPQESVSQVAWVGFLAVMMPRSIMPPWLPVGPIAFRAPKRPQVDPVPPPLCDVNCRLYPVQAIGQ